MVRAPRVVQRNLTTQDEPQRADRHGGEEQATAAAAQPFAPIHPLASRVPDVHFQEIPLQRLVAFGLCGTSNLEGIIAKSDSSGNLNSGGPSFSCLVISPRRPMIAQCSMKKHTQIPEGPSSQSACRNGCGATHAPTYPRTHILARMRLAGTASPHLRDARNISLQTVAGVVDPGCVRPRRGRLQGGSATLTRLQL